jgi:hypothetical protein
MARIIAGMRHRRGNTIGSMQFGKKLVSIRFRKNHQPKWHDSLSEMLPAEAPVQTPWVARQVDIRAITITTAIITTAAATTDLHSRALGRYRSSRLRRHPKPERWSRRGVVMVIIIITLTFAIVA